MPLIRRMSRPGLVGMAARTAVVAGTATAVSGAVAGSRERKAQAQYEQEQYQLAQQQAQVQAAAQAAAAQQTAQPTPPEATAAKADVVEELQKLSALRQAGALSDAEFAAAKAKLLA